MANKLFKGFKQVTAGSFEPEDGYIYFVRNQANTGKTDGFIQFNDRKYGTAEEVAEELEGKIGTLPEGYDDLKSYIDDQISAITGSYATNEALGTLSGRVDSLEAVSAGTRIADLEAVSAGTRIADLEAVSAGTRLSAIEADYLKAEDLTGITDNLSTLGGRVDAIEDDYLSSTDKTELEGAIGTVSGRVDALEAVSASTRIANLESSAHTHDNKAILDAIDQSKVNAWDAMAGGAAVVISAYTGSDAGLTEGYLKTYEIFQGGVSMGKIDIPKDLVVSSGQIVEENGVKYLRLTIANSSTPVDIAVTDLVDVYTPGNGIEISNSNEISAKVVTGNGLSADANGIAMAAADGSNAGAMSAADFTKLGTIDASAQTNVIEEIKVDGTALTVTDKSVNIDLSGKADNATVGTLSGRVDSLEAISADTRLNALEALSGDSHTHSNKAVLDTIDQNKVDAWDGVAGSADTRIAALEASASTWNNVADSADTRLNVLETSAATKTEVATLSGRVDTIENDYLKSSDKTALEGAIGTVSGRVDTLEAISADTRLGALEAVSADTRLSALEALSADTSSALQSVSEGDASVSVGTKANNDQSIAVNISSATGNAMELKNDGLYAAIYYDGNDSE